MSHRTASTRLGYLGHLGRFAHLGDVGDKVKGCGGIRIVGLWDYGVWVVRFEDCL